MTKIGAICRSKHVEGRPDNEGAGIGSSEESFFSRYCPNQTHKYMQATDSDNPARLFSILNETVGTALAGAFPGSFANPRLPIRLLIAGAMCFIVGSGCMTLGTYNSPRTTPEGSTSVGAGTAIVVENEADDGSTVAPLPAAYGRIGLGSRVDVGIKSGSLRPLH